MGWTAGRGAQGDEGEQVFGGQKAFILKQAEEGLPVGEVCREAGISQATFLQLAKGLPSTEMRRPKALEEENARLKKLVAKLTLDKEMLQDVMRRKIVAVVSRTVHGGSHGARTLCRAGGWSVAAMYSACDLQRVGCAP